MIEPKENIRVLHDYLLSHVEKISDRGGAMKPPRVPKFELNARDFLDFAESDLDCGTTQSRVNCISNLKRAVDCQIDTFLHAFNLRTTFEKRGLGLDRRLEFLHESGVFSSRTVGKIGDMRNKLEHEYRVPDVEHLELYFDITNAFVSVLERTISGVLTGNHEFCTGSDWSERLELEYESKGPKITAAIKQGSREITFNARPTDPKYFAYLFRVYLLVTQYQSFVSARSLIKQLREANVS